MASADGFVLLLYVGSSHYQLLRHKDTGLACAGETGRAQNFGGVGEIDTQISQEFWGIVEIHDV